MCIHLRWQSKDDDRTNEPLPLAASHHQKAHQPILLQHPDHQDEQEDSPDEHDATNLQAIRLSRHWLPSAQLNLDTLADRVACQMSRKDVEEHRKDVAE